MQYKNEEEMIREYRDTRSALRWMILATLFMVISFIAQITWFIMLLTKNPNTLAAFIAMVGAFIVAEYCKWCSKDIKPR